MLKKLIPAIWFVSLLLISADVFAVSASWTPPTLYEDGTTLPPTEIQEFRIYGSQTSGGPYTLLTSVPGTQTTATVTVSPGDWYIVATTVATNGAESVYSNEVLKPSLKPGAPSNLTISISGTLTLQVQ